ncbi:MAG: CHAT domain-containing protein [Actinomycetota bacterium]
MSRAGWADVLVRIRALDPSTGAYGLDALADDGHQVTGTLRLDREALRAAELDARRYGMALSESLLAEDVGQAYAAALRRAESRDRGRLRVRLRIDDAAAEVHAVAWERLHHLHRGRPIPVAISQRTPFSRFTETDFGLDTLATRSIRVLFAVSNPTELPEGLPPIAVDEEIRAMHSAVGDLSSRDRIAVTILPGHSGVAADLRQALEADGYTVADGPASLKNLTRLLGDHDVVHVLCHGHFRRESPTGAGTAALYLERDDGRWEAVEDDRLADRVAALDPFCPHLLFFSACESARQDPTHPLVGLAPKLVGAGAPAVVGMQAPVPASLARELTVSFYRSLLDQGLVDVALNEARLQLYEGAEVDWAIPVLFSRLPDGRLFVPGELAGAAVTGKVVLRQTEHGVRADRRRTDRPIRSVPVRALPRDFPDLLDREDEVRAAITALQAGRSVEVIGGPGIGKSTLLRHLVHRVVGPDGVVHGSARGRTVEDLLQYLFDRVHRAEGSYRPTPGELRDALAEVRVMFALDDVELSGEDLGLLMDGAPAAVFLVASPGPVLAGQGETVRLGGLPAVAAVMLFERHLDRPLTEGERVEAQALADTLGGHPQELIQAAARVRDDGIPLEQVVSDAADVRGAAIGTVELATLPEVDRRVLGVLAALGTAPIRAEHLELLTGERDLDEVLERLRRRGLLKAASPAFTLAEGIGPEAVAFLEAETWRERVVEHFLEWGGRNRDDTGMLLRSLDAILAAMEWVGAAGRRHDYLGLARLVEEPLLLARRWGTWGSVLHRSLEAAETVGDEAARAMAHHELGTRALGEGNRRAARDHLRRARRLRKALGDRAGARLTRHNLRLVSPTPWYLGGASAVVAAGVAAVLLALPGGGVTAAPDPVSFGEQDIEGPAVVRTVTLRPASDPVTITDISIEPPLADFRLRNPGRCEGRLETECVVEVVFEPRTSGPLEAALIVSHNGDDSPEEVPIEATGVPPPGVAAIRVDPESLDFGAVPAEATPTQTVTVTNDGGAPLEVENVGLRYTVGPTDAFEVDQDCTADGVPPGGECRIEVTFVHPSRGDIEAELVVRSDAIGSPHRVPISGRTALPDLVAFLEVGDLEVDEKRISVPATVRIVNQGDVAAGEFYVAVSESLQDFVSFFVEETEVVVFDRSGVRVLQLPFEAGENEVTITGRLFFSQTPVSREVAIVATADVCFEEVPPDVCSVPELNETNNDSDPVGILLPGGEPTPTPTPTPTTSPTTPPPVID